MYVCIHTEKELGEVMGRGERERDNLLHQKSKYFRVGVIAQSSSEI
jgi:hypothetical protein